MQGNRIAKGLSASQHYVSEATALARLVIITSDDNRASQQVAEKCGFLYAGPSREDPVHGMVFTWQREQDTKGALHVYPSH